MNDRLTDQVNKILDITSFGAGNHKKSSGLILSKGLENYIFHKRYKRTKNVNYRVSALLLIHIKSMRDNH